MGNRLATALMGVTLKNPVIAASGTFGFGKEYAELIDVSRLGAICGKGLTLLPCPGNAGVRVWETAAGMMNSIGLENPGVKHFCEFEAPAMRKLGPAVAANLGGHSESDYIEGARLLAAADIDILELNISCPNIKGGGMAFGASADTAAAITRLVRREYAGPLLVKLTPASDVPGVAAAVEAAGADGVTVCNTFPAMAVDIKARRPVFGNVYAGLSGPAIKPLSLRLVHQTAKTVKIPVVASGGIASAEDALEFIMAGAAAVEIGCASFRCPAAALDVIDGLEKWCENEGIDSIADIRGIL